MNGKSMKLTVVGPAVAVFAATYRAGSVKEEYFWAFPL